MKHFLFGTMYYSLGISAKIALILALPWSLPSISLSVFDSECLRLPCPCTWASRLFQPVQYGQKPEGRTVAFPNTHPPRTATPATATATPQGHVRGRPPIATFSANPDAKGMLLRGLCSASQRVFVEEIPLALSPAPRGCVTTPLSRSGTVCSDSPRRPCVVLT